LRGSGVGVWGFPGASGEVKGFEEKFRRGISNILSCCGSGKTLKQREREREREVFGLPEVWVECGVLRCVRRCEGCGGNAEFREPGHGHREEEEEEEKERLSSRYAVVLSPLDPKSTAKDCRITGLQVLLCTGRVGKGSGDGGVEAEGI
jgi:hypothetical protein